MASSRNGDFNGRHWRTAGKDGWFSYKMKNTSGDATCIMFTFAGNDSADAVIYVNDIEVGRIAAGSTGKVDIEVPAAVISEKIMTVMIKPDSKERTPHMFEVRLMR